MSSRPNLALAVDRESAVPIFRQLYQRVRAAIADGRLQPGERLPSARSLAAQLGAARGTIEAAYAMLSGEGWIMARGAAGTVVAGQLSARSSPQPASVPLVYQAAAQFGGAGSAELFRMGLPALDAFPRKLWARLAAREARSISAVDSACQTPRVRRPCGRGSRPTWRSPGGSLVRLIRCSSPRAIRGRSA